MQQLKRYDDDDVSEQKAIEKYLRVVPKKFKQIALAIEMLLDLSELMVQEVTGRLKAVDDCDELAPGVPNVFDVPKKASCHETLLHCNRCIH
jgi:hypothetical protein